MVKISALTTFASLIVATTAHTRLMYPPWRTNLLVSPFSEYIFPCGGSVSNETTVRTPWPINGGSLNFTLGDDASILFVNLGIGSNVTNFNISLIEPLNSEGSGQVCFSNITLPEDIQALVSEGTQATLQVSTANPVSGAALYTCADIVFSANATLLAEDQCRNSSEVTFAPLFSEGNASNGSSSSTNGSSTRPNGASIESRVSYLALLGSLLVVPVVLMI